MKWNVNEENVVEDISDAELLSYLVGFPNSPSSSSNSSFYEDERKNSTIEISTPNGHHGMLECWEPGEIIDPHAELNIGQFQPHDFTSRKSDHSFHQRKNNNRKTLDDVFMVGDDNLKKSSNKLLNGKKRGPRPKTLTREEKKQKRMDANDRERQRMGELNVAFNNLRHLLPRHKNDRELSKFETIQIAKNYIKALHDMAYSS